MKEIICYLDEGTNSLYQDITKQCYIGPIDTTQGYSVPTENKSIVDSGYPIEDVLRIIDAAKR